jgi:hypothetical protein
MVDRVASTLLGAAVTEEGRELLVHGRLTEQRTTTGFDIAGRADADRRGTAEAEAKRRRGGARHARRGESPRA